MVVLYCDCSGALNLCRPLVVLVVINATMVISIVSRVNGCHSRALQRRYIVLHIAQTMCRMPLTTQIRSHTVELHSHSQLNSGPTAWLSHPAKPRVTTTSWQSHPAKPRVTTTSWQSHPAKPRVTTTAWQSHPAKPRVTTTSWQSHPAKPRVTTTAWLSHPAKPRVTTTAWLSHPAKPEWDQALSHVRSAQQLSFTCNPYHACMRLVAAMYARRAASSLSNTPPLVGWARTCGRGRVG